MVVRLFLIFCVSLLIGCGADSRTYTVSIRNEAMRPVTIALTKTGGPTEDKWASPEDIAGGRSKSSAEHGIAVVGRGRTATVTNQQGQFPAGAEAVIRVYGGDPTLGEMLKIHPGPSRVDLTLPPGRSDLVVRETASGFTIARRDQSNP